MNTVVFIPIVLPVRKVFAMDSRPDLSDIPGPVSQPQDNQQRRELVVLNSIFEIISNAANLTDTLQEVLDFVLSMVNSTIGWVCLHEKDGGCISFTGYKGLCFANSEDGKASPCLVHCVCDRVRRTKEIVIVNALAKGCPLLLIEGEPEEAIVGHISVPLKTKSRLVGQLNIAFDHPGQIGPADVELLRAIGPQLAVAIENARLWDEIQTKELMLKKLLNNVVFTQEEERRRISRELHDEMGQNLTSLLLGMRVLENADSCSQKESLIQGMSETVCGMIAFIHDLALELRPPMLDDLGLIPALTRYLEDCPARLGLAVDYEIVGSNGRRLSRDAEITVYRIVQESLTNVVRHAQATRASVILNQGSDALRVIIEDAGVGFETKQIRSGDDRDKHLGLFSMEERAALAGGRLTVESSPGHGTSIYIEVPWEPGHAA